MISRIVTMMTCHWAPPLSQVSCTAIRADDPYSGMLGERKEASHIHDIPDSLIYRVTTLKRTFTVLVLPSRLLRHPASLLIVRVVLKQECQLFD